MGHSKKYLSLLPECKEILLQSKWRDLLVGIFDDVVNIEVY